MLTEHLTTIPHEVPEKQLAGVDYIYLINLDDRKDRLQQAHSQFASYKLNPQRFPAISGNNLPAATLDAVGLRFEPKMEGDNWVLDFSHPDKLEFTFLRKEHHGKTFFSKRTSKGAIGCSLSHLSAIQDAYNRNYETIWILEDDCKVEQDPHLLSDILKKMPPWDILYTDLDEWPEDANIGFPLEDLLWRPDMPSLDLAPVYKRTILNEQLLQIGLKFRATSYLLSRSGMKKILDFYSRHNLFLPWDLELSLIPNLKMFRLRKSIVAHFPDEPSNIQDRQWQEFKMQSLALSVPKNSGWYEQGKAALLMDFVHEKKPDQVVTAGFFSGSSALALAFALSYNVKGKLHIHFTVDNATVQKLANVTLDTLKTHLTQFIQNVKLTPFCDFSPPDQPIDLLYLDNTFGGSTSDLTTLFPLVRPGGYIYLNGAEHWANRPAVSFLMDHATWLRDKSLGIECTCFQKKNTN